jgi:hypothetical protein
VRFLPQNRNISVELIEDEKIEEGNILLPADYQAPPESYVVVRVSDDGAATDCKRNWEPGWLLVVEAQMIREITYGDQIYRTITENYVIGSLSDHERT